VVTRSISSWGWQLNPQHGNLDHLSAQADNLPTTRPSSDSKHWGCSAQAVRSSFAGINFTSADCAAPESCWIGIALAERADLRRVDGLAGGEMIGRKSGNYARILVPYSSPSSDRVREHRLRRDPHECGCEDAGSLKPRQKYLDPPGDCFRVWRNGLRSRQAAYRECR